MAVQQQELLVFVRAVLGGPAAEVGGGPAGHGDRVAVAGLGLLSDVALRQPGEGYVHLIHVVHIERLTVVLKAELPQAETIVYEAAGAEGKIVYPQVVRPALRQRRQLVGEHLGDGRAGVIRRVEIPIGGGAVGAAGGEETAEGGCQRQQGEGGP